MGKVKSKIQENLVWHKDCGRAWYPGYESDAAFNFVSKIKKESVQDVCLKIAKTMGSIFKKNIINDLRPINAINEMSRKKINKEKLKKESIEAYNAAKDAKKLSKDDAAYSAYIIYHLSEALCDLNMWEFIISSALKAAIESGNDRMINRFVKVINNHKKC